MNQPDHIIRGDELPATSRTGLHLPDGGDDRLFYGRVKWAQLRDGLSLHWSDCEELQDFVTENTVDPRVSFVLFLQGQSQVSYGDLSLTLGHPSSRRAPEGVAVSMNEPVQFRRQARRGSHIRKLVVSLTPDWFEGRGEGVGATDGAIRRFMGSHLTPRVWKPSSRLLTLADQMLNPPGYDALLASLYLESRALDIACEALASLGEATTVVEHGLRPQEYRRLQRLVDLLDSGEADSWSLDHIARETGVNATTLQRQFRSLKGMTVFEYQRGRRLNSAREALEREGATVTEAAWRAGYNSPANFATAFKRQFGISPRQVRSRV
ncbi:MAG: AraC family transcriptional regulator [Gammaproteobacteria bacterium]|uniref:helix-turn-helix transcriptional regulator n=1 Tax=Stutzerimonas xanthomarina TaxID=271420 RepID=UPI000E9AF18C|nr:AraC family transcriptional regulator [Stutzerimonas xanthomarina]MBU0811274.1 AraC family transcriptional regulator [Gammaproteobacteria bacterium]HAW25986.1 AraC family transcriptional regulator [Pseudomonas sp.]MBK3844814.1 helix-turn-helix domain-containing protein [Stutzerimonas xanthomarina]MBU0852823.1 AraC family transcriptional regulator [Gammaproteobacteria bacterium]MBU1303056.1 AraC family transcriptional regulator [Gammaproteobacteria bacterium]|tara:strand:- start:287 stop:1255 length:969 start_codon:yes stop_codon:yes gene_type:complete